MPHTARGSQAVQRVFCTLLTPLPAIVTSCCWSFCCLSLPCCCCLSLPCSWLAALFCAFAMQCTLVCLLLLCAACGEVLEKSTVLKSPLPHGQVASGPICAELIGTPLTRRRRPARLGPGAALPGQSVRSSPCFARFGQPLIETMTRLKRSQRS